MASANDHGAVTVWKTETGEPVNTVQASQEAVMLSWYRVQVESLRPILCETSPWRFLSSISCR